MDQQIATLQKWIDESQNIVFFGGAGVSTESGIPDFRSVDGLYNQSYAYPPETILSASFFAQHPEAAGSKVVYELHGSTLRNYCVRCKKKYSIDYLFQTTGVPRCSEPHCKGIVRPDVVLYEEGLDPDVISGAVAAIRKADMLIIGGTSLVVYPAAGLVNYYSGKKLVLINKSRTSMDSSADLAINAPIGQVFSQITVG